MSARQRIPACVVALWLAACTSASMPAGAAPGPADCLLLNGKPIPILGTTDMLEFMRRLPTTQHMMARNRRGDPFVLVDGIVRSPSPGFLASLSVHHVASLTVLPPVEATWRFGGAARNGAVLIRTRSSAPAGGCAAAETG